MTTFTFDGISSETIPEVLVMRVRRPLVGARRDEYVEVPGREGFWLFPEKPGGRLLQIDFDILADTFADRRAAVVELADLLAAPAGLAQLIVDDEPDRFHLCRLASNPDPDEWLTHGAFTVDLNAEPYSQMIVPSSEVWSGGSAGAHPFTPGDTVEAWPEIELTATGGTVTSFSLDVNGDVLVYALGGLGLTAGQSLTVSSLSFTVCRGLSEDPDLVGAFDPDDLDMATVSGDFGSIVSGANDVTLTYTGTAPSVARTVRWRRRSR